MSERRICIDCESGRCLLCTGSYIANKGQWLCRCPTMAHPKRTAVSLLSAALEESLSAPPPERFTYETVLDKPGIYDLPVELYHRDPCPEPSLSASGIHILDTATPAHFAAKHPKLTRWPNRLEKRSDAMDFGTVVHAIALGKGHKIARLDLADFYNKDGSPAKTWGSGTAKRAWADAEASGAIPIAEEDYQRAAIVAENIVTECREEYGVWPVGLSEQVIVWQRHAWVGDERVMVWCRAMADIWAVDELRIIMDLKSSDLPLSDVQVSSRLAGSGKDIQAAWYIEGAETVRPELRNELRFVFAFAEMNPPFCVRFGDMPDSWRATAATRIDTATNLFARCLLTGEWPKYQERLQLRIPPWRDLSWADAEISASEEEGV